MQNSRGQGTINKLSHSRNVLNSVAKKLQTKGTAQQIQLIPPAVATAVTSATFLSKPRSDEQLEDQDYSMSSSFLTMNHSVGLMSTRNISNTFRSPYETARDEYFQTAKNLSATTSYLQTPSLNNFNNIPPTSLSVTPLLQPASKQNLVVPLLDLERIQKQSGSSKERNSSSLLLSEVRRQSTLQKKQDVSQENNNLKKKEKTISKQQDKQSSSEEQQESSEDEESSLPSKNLIVNNFMKQSYTQTPSTSSRQINRISIVSQSNTSRNSFSGKDIQKPRPSIVLQTQQQSGLGFNANKRSSIESQFLTHRPSVTAGRDKLSPRIRFDNQGSQTTITTKFKGSASQRPSTSALDIRSGIQDSPAKKGILKPQTKLNIENRQSIEAKGSESKNESDPNNDAKLNENFSSRSSKIIIDLRKNDISRMSVGEKLRTFIQRNMQEFKNLDSNEELEYQPQVERRSSRYSVAYNPNEGTNQPGGKERMSFLSKLGLRNNAQSPRSEKYAESLSPSRSSILNTQLVKKKITLIENMAKTSQQQSNNMQKTVLLRQHNKKMNSQNGGGEGEESEGTNLNSGSGNTNGNSQSYGSLGQSHIFLKKLSMVSDDSDESSDLEGEKKQTKNQSKKAHGSPQPKQKQQKKQKLLNSEQMNETLLFWNRLKKEIYAETELEKQYKKNCFDENAIRCYLTIIRKINETCESRAYDMHGYEEIEDFLDEILLIFKKQKHLTSFFQIRLLTLQGKFTFKCGNIYNAMKSFMAAKRIATVNQDFRRKLRIHHFIGQSFKLLKNYLKAKGQFIKMLKLSWVTDDKVQELKAYDELGIIYYYNCELLVAQRLHRRLCENITEDSETSQIRKIIVEAFRKNHRNNPKKHTNMLVPSPEKQSSQNLAKSVRLSSDSTSSTHLLNSQLRRESVRKSNLSTDHSQTAENKQEQREKDELENINVAFSDSSEEEQDFFVRELTQQDIIREDILEKEKILEERSVPSLKNIWFRYSKLSQERQNNKQTDQIFQRMAESERLQSHVDDGFRKKNPQIIISHLSRNRYFNNYKEDSFKEHQYFHLKQYQDKVFTQFSDVRQTSSLIIDQDHAPITMRSQNLDKKSGVFRGSQFFTFDKDDRQHGTTAPAEISSTDPSGKIAKALFKFNVPLTAFNGMIKDLTKLKQQLILLLNNIEKFESTLASTGSVKRKNALHFF